MNLLIESQSFSAVFKSQNTSEPIRIKVTQNETIEISELSPDYVKADDHTSASIILIGKSCGQCMAGF